ncbi:MAG TPA: hypothetical protein VNW95_01950 [Mucilaginibacter sp.]|jgi:hypothetical protein|nr:hypothetical protein [Mucilaginibacter sp.]
MTFSYPGFNLKKAISYVDWKLLLFLMLFLNVKLAVKIPAIIIIYLLRFNFRFGVSFKNSRLPLFYFLIIGIGFLGLIINQHNFGYNYLVVFLTGIGFWLLCILAVHQVKLAVEQNDTQVIHNTILVFFVLNAIFSFYNIAQIIWETGAFNPYRYQGQYQKYFIGTGDYIRGITFDTSTTNAVLNAFGVTYFLTRKKPLMVLTCMAVLLLTGSNFINIILLAILAFLFIFNSSKDQKSLIVVCLMFLVVFMAKISPQSNKYVAETFRHIVQPRQAGEVPVANDIQANALSGIEEARQKIAKHYLDSLGAAITLREKTSAPVSPALRSLPVTQTGRVFITKPDINTPPYQTRTDTDAEQRRLISFINSHKADLRISGDEKFKPGLPGKIISLSQTAIFLKQHPAKIALGDGVGNFSSKLAFRATGLGFAGGYPLNRVYINKDFLVNHLDIYLNFFSRRIGLHSLVNSPNSVYNQLLAEYGLLGLLAFAICYVGFFARHVKKLTYGIPLLLMIMAVFFIDYWFEQLSILVFFELMLLLNIKETAHLKPAHYGLK